MFAGDVSCPTADKLRAEWSISSLRGTEQINNEMIMIYQKGHYYGTDKKWYVNFSVEAKDAEEALKKASEVIKQAQFIGGGMTPFGYYSCGYNSLGVTIYANANS